MASVAFGKPQPPADIPDAKESTTIRFEWTLKGLKSIFEGSKGEAKSKVIKSPRFGDGRWSCFMPTQASSAPTDKRLLACT
ncbi:hypothetical protein BD413DRAFT_551210 [Trametes elegans]|nr:hypothetical protein BD413DRAFT_551210 [Trametes elegans]